MEKKDYASQSWHSFFCTATGTRQKSGQVEPEPFKSFEVEI